MDTTSQPAEMSFSDSLLAEAGITPQPATDTQNTTTTTEDKPADEQAEKPADTKADTTTPADDKKEDQSTQTTADTTTGTDEADIDDEKLLALLSKKTGRTYKSLDEFSEPKPQPTEQEVAQLKEQTRSQAIEFGKVNKFFSQTDYDKFVVFQGKTPTEVVQENFVENFLKENPSMEETDAVDLFNQIYQLGEDEDSFAYRQAQKLLDKEYNEIKNSQFGKIIGVEDKYTQHQQQLAKETSFSNQVNKLFTDKLPKKFEFVIDKEPLSFPIDPKDKETAKLIEEIKANYLTVNMMNSTVDQTGKLNEEILLSEIKKDLTLALSTKMVTEIAKSYADIKVTKNRMGRRGVIDIDEATSHATGAAKGDSLSLSDQMLQEEGFPVNANKN